MNVTRARSWIAAHRKLIVVAAGTLITVAVQVWGTTNPYVALAILAATAAGVYGAPNTPAPPPPPAPPAAQPPEVHH